MFLKQNKNKTVLFVFTLFMFLTLITLLLHSKIMLGINMISSDLSFKHNVSLFNKVYNLSLNYPYYYSEDQNSLIKITESSEIVETNSYLQIAPQTLNTSRLPKATVIKIEPDIGKSKFKHTYLNYKDQKRIIGREFIESTTTNGEILIKGTEEFSIITNTIEDSFVKTNVGVEDEYEFAEINLFDFEQISFDFDNKVVVFAYVDILFPECNYYIEQKIGYNIISNQYTFPAISDLVEYSCSKTGFGPYPSPVRLATCSDCTYFRIDKTTFLPSDYQKPTKSLENLKIQGEVAVEMFDDLEALYTDSRKAGFKTNITSSYRSFERQQEVFKYWVDREKQLFGRSQKDAEISANTYSARPGFSEHQLATTVDINNEKCSGFDGFCSANEDIWKWLDENAWKYGFIRSYPEGREKETGYIGEAWHYRWLGRDVAKEYIENSGGKTLNFWLDDRYYDQYKSQL